MLISVTSLISVLGWRMVLAGNILNTGHASSDSGPDAPDWCPLQAQTTPRMGRTVLVVTQKCHLSCFCCCFCAQGAAAPSCGQVKARKGARLTSTPLQSIFHALGLHSMHVRKAGPSEQYCRFSSFLKVQPRE